MSEVKRDAAIKLFGMTISLPCSEKDESLSENIHSSFESSNSHDSKDESIHDYDSTNPSEDKSSEEEPTSSETNGGDSKKDESGALKKPDKIIPCPRCASMDTKFCYFNNYNVNQPRHFCKKCQRYWTSGGTMRNVPVGSGRRKTKNALLPTYPNMIISNSDILDSSNGNFLISPRGFPVSFYPATLYWGSSVLHNTDDPPQLRVPVLGKHSRDGKENHNGILVPKTLRIHDPIEAAKSSIWSTLGIKNGNNGMFEAFESKGDRHTSVGEREMMMQANPAAFSRSLNFHERV